MSVLTSVPRVLLAVVPTACLLLVGIAPTAVADPEIGAAEVGTVDVRTVEGDGDDTPIGTCDVSGPQRGEVDGILVFGVADIGTSTSTCGRDEDAIIVGADGRDFVLYALSGVGGPTIRINRFSAGCTATQGGARASMTVRGVTGFDVPDRIPSNYTISVPGADGTTAATVVLNATRFGDRGRVDLDAVRITLHGDGGEAPEGVIRLGTVRCAPPLL